MSNLYSFLRRFSGRLGLPSALLLLWALSVSTQAQAQLDYTYAITNEPYSTVTGSDTTLGTPTSLDDGTFTAINIPFSFNFNGTNYSSVRLNTNGTLFFGTTASTTYVPTTLVGADAGLDKVMVLGRDLIYNAANAYTSSYATIGTAPNRQFVVQVENVSTYNVAANTLKFQIILEETTNKIIFNYADFNIATAPGTLGACVGLRSTDITVFKTLTSTSTDTSAWTTGTSVSTAGAVIMPLTVGIFPPTGTRITWTPTPPAANDMAVSRFLNVPTATNICDSSVFSNVGIVLRNRGANAIASPAVTVEITNLAGTVISTTTLTAANSLAAGNSDTLFLSPIQVLGIDTYRIRVTNNNADDISANDTLFASLRTSRECRLPPYTYSTNLGTFSPLVGGNQITDWGTTFNPPAYGSASIPIPFIFAFNGIQYPSVNVSTNGYITFSNTIPGNFNYTDNGYWNVYNEQNVVAAFARNMYATNVTYGIDPTSNDFVIDFDGQQYDFGTLEGYVHFQYRLKRDYSIVLSYDSVLSGSTRNPTVGLGLDNAGFYALSHGASNTWADAVATTTPTSVMNYTPNTTSVPSGLNFVFTPTFSFTPPANDLSLVRLQNVPTATNNCDSSIFSNIRVVVNNNGTAAAPITSLNVRITNVAGTVTNLTVLGNRALPSGTADTVSLGDIQVIGIDTYSILVTPSASDEVTRNDTLRFSLVTTRDCQLPPYTYSTTIGTFSPLAGGTAITNWGTSFRPQSYGAATIDIPFVFAFNGTIYSSVNVSTNGYINFDAVQPGLFNYTDGGYWNNYNEPNVVAAFARNTYATTVRYGLDAASGDFVIDFEGQQYDFGPLEGYIHYQYRLQRNSTIVISYDSVLSTSTRNPTVGLGINNASFYSLTNGTSTTWANAESTTAATSTMNYTPNVTSVPNGLSFTFTPTFPFSVPANDVSVSTLLGMTNAVCQGNTYSNIALSIVNNGTNANSNPSFVVDLIDINSTVLSTSNVTYSGTLAVGATDTLAITSTFAIPNITGQYAIRVRVATADDYARNDTFYYGMNAIACVRPVYTVATTIGSYVPSPATATDITNGVGDNGTTGRIIPLGFSLFSAGFPINSIFVSTNGYIALQFPNTRAAQTFQANPMNSTYFILAPFATNLYAGAGSSITYETTGSGTSTATTVYWNNMSGVTGTTENTAINASFSATIEANGTVTYRYGNITSTVASSAQIGLTGTSNFNFIDLGLNYDSRDWSSLSERRLFNRNVNFGPGYNIPNGLTVSLTPPPPAANDLAVLGAFGVPAATGNCDSLNINLRVLVTNPGSNASSNSSVTVTLINTTTGAVAYSTTVNGRSTLASLGSDTITIPTFQAIDLANYGILLTLPGDDISSNDTAAYTFAVDQNCGPAPFSFSTTTAIPFSTLVGGTNVWPTATDDAILSVSLPTTFPTFNFNGVDYSSINVSSNGFITFGALPTSNAGSNTLYTNSVMAFARDIVATVRTGVDATTGDFIIEWDGYNYNVTTETVNFQIRLQTDNTIVMAYNNMTPAAGRTAFVGINVSPGQLTDLTLATGVNDWGTPTLVNSTANNPSMPLYGTDPTVSVPFDLRYVWTPPSTTPAPNLVAVSITGTTPTACAGTSINPRVRVRNIGTQDVATYDVRFRVVSPSGTNVTTVTRNRSPFGAGIIDSVALGTPLVLTQAGSYTISAVVIASGDNIRTNDSTGVRITVSQATTVAPTITVTGSTNICPGQSVLLTAPTATVYRWSNGATTPSITVNNPGSYTLQVGSNAACLSPVSTPVVVTAPTNGTPRPTISTSGSTSFCNGSAISVTLTSSTSDQYMWSNGATTQSITVTAAGNYYVYTILTSAGCRSFNSDTVRVTTTAAIATPTVSASGALTFCDGNSVILTSSAAPAGSTYLWSQSGTPLAIPTRAITVTTSGTYTVQIVTSGCTSLASTAQVVTTTTAPSAVAIAAVGATSVCAGTEVVLVAPAGSPSYRWLNGTTPMPGQNTDTLRATASGIYSVQVGAGSCYSPSSNSINVVVAPVISAPTINNSGTSAICAGSSTTLTASGAAPGATYLWSTGETTPSIVVRTAGTITVRSVVLGQCTSAASPPLAISILLVDAVPTINTNGNILTATGSFTTGTFFEWLKDGRVIIGNSTNTLNISSDANTGIHRYQVRSVRLNSCKSDTSTSSVINGISSAVNRSSELKAFPIPTSNTLHISLPNVEGTKVAVRLIDNLGKEVYFEEVSVAGSLATDINVNNLPSGMYQLLVNGDKLAVSKTIIKK